MSYPNKTSNVLLIISIISNDNEEREYLSNQLGRSREKFANLYIPITVLLLKKILHLWLLNSMASKTYAH